MKFTKIQTLAAAFSTLATSSAAFNSNSKSNVVLYWGQNETTQHDISYYCENDLADVLILSFKDAFKDVVSVASTDLGSVFSDFLGNTAKINATELSQQIEKCQAAGSSVLLSISDLLSGTTSEDPVAIARTIWGTFGPKNISTSGSISRVFGNVALDGFDLSDAVSNNTTAAQVINELQTLFSGETLGDYVISAIASLPLTDVAREVFTNAEVDYVFIELVNNTIPTIGKFNVTSFLGDISVIKNKDVSIFLDVVDELEPSVTDLASDLVWLIPFIIKLESGNFAGISISDIGKAVETGVDIVTFIKALKTALEEAIPELEARDYKEITVTTYSLEKYTNAGSLSSSSSLFHHLVLAFASAFYVLLDMNFIV